jgi:hypothetical protein
MNVRCQAFKIFVPILFGFVLQGCGGGDEDAAPVGGAGPVGADDPDADIDVSLDGSVGDGPVVDAEIVVQTNTGIVLQNVVGSQLAGYNVTLKTKGKHFPLFIEATGGTDLVTNLPPDFRLRSAALAAGKRATANLNPFTTLALATADQMSGGPTSTNVRTALAATTAKLNSGLTTLAAGGVMDATINDSNLAEIVKSSETLAEMLRRVHSIRRASGRSSSVDDVVQVIGADLTDGKLDGRGAARTDAHASAIAALASAQVVVESMTNNLRVNGQPATAALDGAINRLASRAVAAPTASLPITAGMIEAARTGTAAASAIVPSPALTALQQSLSALTPGMLPAAAAQALPSGAAAALEPALTQITAGAASDIAAVNAIGGGGIVPSNRAPTITGTPPSTATVGAAYSFTPTASDPDGGTLTFAIQNRPSWTTFNTTTGRLTGTPAAANVGTFPNILISVSDGAASAALAAFTIAVNPAPNSAPTISGAPSTSVLQGTAYSFQPTASDADADTLTFSIVNRPAWATFDSATGRLQGTPGPGDVGTTTGIVIAVSDGKANASLAAFDIAVQAVATGSATLTWLPPTTNTDGSPLTNLAGFKVYWGTTSGNYSSSTTIMNPGLTRYVVENLTPNTYYFAVKAVNSAGIESVFSNTASKTIQ